MLNPFRIPIVRISSEAFNELPRKESWLYLVENDDSHDIWFSNIKLHFGDKQFKPISNVSMEDRQLIIRYLDGTTKEVDIPKLLNVPTFEDNALNFGDDTSVDLSSILTPVAGSVEDIDKVPNVELLVELVAAFFRGDIEVSQRNWQ